MCDKYEERRIPCNILEKDPEQNKNKETSEEIESPFLSKLRIGIDLRVMIMKDRLQSNNNMQFNLYLRIARAMDAVN